MHAQTYARLYAHVEYSLLCQGNYILFMCATAPSSGQSEEINYFTFFLAAVFHNEDFLCLFTNDALRVQKNI